MYLCVCVFVLLAQFELLTVTVNICLRLLEKAGSNPIHCKMSNFVNT